MQSVRKTFVLVHGACHGGWCWRRVADLLERDGHKVFTPTLTGLGDRAHLLTRDVNLSTHVADVSNLIEWEDLTDIVLVGHSYGGFVISGVADRLSDRISSIVFLDAFLPENGECMFEKLSPVFQTAAKAALEKGEISFDPPPASLFGVQAEDRSWVEAKMTPQPIHTFTERVSHSGGRDKIAKKAYIRATAYMSASFDAHVEQIKAKADWKLFEIATGHDMMITAPGELTDLLLQLA